MSSNHIRTNYIRIRVGGPAGKGEESLTYREAYVLKILGEKETVYKNLLIREYNFPPKIAHEVLERLKDRKILQSVRHGRKNLYRPTDYGMSLTSQLTNLYAVTAKDFKPLPHEVIKDQKKGINVGGGEFEIRFLKDNSLTPLVHVGIMASFHINSHTPYVRSTKGIPFISFKN